MNPESRHDGGDEVQKDGIEHAPIQIDIYGVKVHASPSAPNERDPRSWGEVANQVGQSLRNAVRDLAGVLADIPARAGRGLLI